MAVTQTSATAGDEVYIGFNSNTYAGHITQDVSYSTEAETEVIRDEVNDTVAVISSDPRTKKSMSMVILTVANGGSLTPPAVNSLISINSEKWRVEDASIKLSATSATLDVTLMREDSMATEYDTP